jgi:hypothetical protein
LNNQKLRAEPFLNLPKQFIKCKAFEHIAANCPLNSIVCGKCAGDHPDNECNSNNSIKCVNCQGSHSAYHRGCLKFKEIKNNLLVNNNIKFNNNSNNRISYAKIVSQQEQIKNLSN